MIGHVMLLVGMNQAYQPFASYSQANQSLSECNAKPFDE